MFVSDKLYFATNIPQLGPIPQRPFNGLDFPRSTRSNLTLNVLVLLIANATIC